MNKEQSKYMQLHIEFDDTVDQHTRDMLTIHAYMDMLSEIFNKEITWTKLSDDPNLQLKQLSEIITEVKKISSKGQEKITEETRWIDIEAGEEPDG